MKFLGADAARVILIFPPEEIRGESSTFGPTYIQRVQERYQFAFATDPVETKGDLSSLVFRIGSLDASDGPLNIAEFTMLQNGVIVDARSTDDGELFIQDLLNWSIQTFGWREPTTVRARYFSSIVVEFEREVESLFSELEALNNVFGSALRDAYAISEPYSLKGLILSCDPMLIPSSAIQTDITIQRRVETPFSANRFHCTGPFRTAEFVTLMEQAEAALLGKRKRK